MEKFFKDIYQALLLHIDFETIKVLLVGSPGFTNDEFLEYLHQRTLREESSSSLILQKHRQKILKVHASSGYKIAIEEMMSDSSIIERLNNVRAVEEIKTLQAFERMLMEDPDRVCYGFVSVQYASQAQAIDTLLITDHLFRSNNFQFRNEIGRILTTVKQSGGRVLKFSIMHSSGERLEGMTGIAAILRYPFPNLDEQAEAAAGTTINPAILHANSNK
jgi:protein pelota